MFYGIIQKGLDKWNGAFFCGSAAVIRREALKIVGGFSGITITEDCETALDLHSRGWRSMYIDKPMISGLQPETFSSFIGQRSRWARGMFQIFLLKNPVLKRGLTLAQKICYLSNMTYWFFPFFRLPFFVSPLLFIFFNMQIYIANAQEFISYTVLYMIANMMMQNYLYGAVRWALVSEVYEYVQTLYLARGLFSVILNPYKPTFNVTDKGNSLDKDHLSELSTPFFVLFAVYSVSMVVCVLALVHRARRQRTARRRGDVESVQSVDVGGLARRHLRAPRLPRRRSTGRSNVAIGSAILPGKALDVSYGGCRVSLPADRLSMTDREGAPAVIDVRLRAGGGAQSFPVVVSNVADARRSRRDRLRLRQVEAPALSGDRRSDVRRRQGASPRFAPAGVAAAASCTASPPSSPGRSSGPPRGFRLLAAEARALRAAPARRWRSRRPRSKRPRPTRPSSRRRRRRARSDRMRSLAMRSRADTGSVSPRLARRRRGVAPTAIPAAKRCTGSAPTRCNCGSRARPAPRPGRSTSRPRRRGARARIHLGYTNAISVMPEASTLSISVNDVPVAQTPIAAATDPGALDVELPRGLLTQGYNSVRIAVAQRHRVDCSMEATYELWTQLDPATSRARLSRRRRSQCRRCSTISRRSRPTPPAP